MSSTKYEVASKGGEASSFPLPTEEARSGCAAMLQDLRHRSPVLGARALPYGLAGSVCSYCPFSLPLRNKATTLPSPGILPQAPAQVSGQRGEGTHWTFALAH